MAHGLLSVVICAAFVVTANCGNIPDYIHVCKRSDPHVAKCIRALIDFIKPRLRNGIEELDLPGLEPLRVSDIDFFRIVDPTGSSGFKAILKDLDVYGFSDFQLTKLKVNIPNVTFSIEVVLPFLRLVGRYDVNARILLVPIKGEGKLYANGTNCVYKAVLRGNFIEQNGEKYMNFTNLDLKFHIGDYNFRLVDLFNGDPVLSQAAMNIFNHNKQEFLEAARPFAQGMLSDSILEHANKISKNFPYDDMFPEK